MTRRCRAPLPTVTDCNGCGGCCMHMGYPTYFRDTDAQGAEEHWTSLPGELQAELLSFIAAYKTPARGELDPPCYWFDIQTRRCKHHEHRPRVCRDFKIGSRDCLGWREQYCDETTSSLVPRTNVKGTLVEGTNDDDRTC